MKNMPLSKLRRKSNAYFKNLGVVKKGKRRRSTIEYIIQRTYESLPSSLRDYIEDPDQAIQALTNIIAVSDNDTQINPYQALKHTAEYAKRKTGDNTKQFLWNRFRNEESSIYAKFNSYMYRQGLSARNYWFKNVVFENHGSAIHSYCELPIRPKGIQYYMLEIDYDFSGEQFNAYLT